MLVRASFHNQDSKKSFVFPSDEEIASFPKIMEFEGDNYEFFFYDISNDGGFVDACYEFSKISMYDPRANETAPNFFRYTGLTLVRDCECGSKMLGHPAHSNWCPVVANSGREE